jgi:hypothetical protein
MRYLHKLTPIIAKVKNESSYISISPVHLHGVVLNEAMNTS